VEIRVHTRIKTDIKIQHNRPDLFVYVKKRKEITLIELGINNLDLLTQVENEKTRKYDLIANMQGENYTICDDLGGFGYEIPLEAQQGI
jgi:hypothetical protein